MNPADRSATQTLFYSPGACSLAPHIVLEEIGQPFSLVLVSTDRGETHTPEFLSVNPKGRIPVLVTGNTVLTEAPAILLHLAVVNPGAGLIQNSDENLVRSIEWFNYLSGTVHSVAVKQIWRPEYFTTDQSQHQYIVARGKENLADAFKLINERLSRTDWAVGEQYSIVDPYLLVFYRWGNRMAMPMESQYKSWTQHTNRLLERGAVGRALSKEGVSVWR